MYRKTNYASVIDFLKDYDKKLINFSDFKSNYIWNKENKLLLLDSIKKGYPIGSIVIWKTDYYDKNYHVLDGFNRLSTLIDCLINGLNTFQQSENVIKQENYFVYNCNTDQIYEKEKDLSLYEIPLRALISGLILYPFKDNLKKTCDEITLISCDTRISNTGKQFADLEFPCCTLYGGTLEEAKEVFYRLNLNKLTTSI
jgi:uncharacterized protein with ParB-like and HNH nuclease domain